VITTVAPTISAAGVSAPAYADILTFMVSNAQTIFGSDTFLQADSQDYEMLAVVASGFNDINAAALVVAASFSPSSAGGAALSSVVKINGISKDVATFSTVDVQMSGVAGTTISNGVVQDTASSNKWSLPATVVIPPSGVITVTATCQTVGAITALANTVTKMQTVTLGWQSVTNASAATPGAPVESDADLRQRQTISTAIPSQTVLDGIVGAVASVPGIGRYRGYENDTAIADVNGIPSHSIAIVIEGGDATAIANAIAAKKTPGGGTYGTTTVFVTDVYGIPHPINFFRPTQIGINIAIGLSALSGYNSTIGVEIQNTVTAFVNGLGTGNNVIWTRLFVPANLSGSADGQTYKINSLTVNGGTSDVMIGFNAEAVIVSVTVAAF
jgi:uncharacterized phage protein gp47/JayE